MGAVYEARHTGTGRRVAVKVITSDLAKTPGLVQRFEVEARAGGGVDSQYIAQVLDTGADETGAPYIVMEYLVGEDLFQLISRISPLPVQLALRILAQACLGLEKAHQGKIIHRDIKPANIFLNEREGDEVGVKILDFGVAKIKAEEGQAVSSLTRTGSLLGSPLYMSPEQARGDKAIDQRSDIWSLGVVLYEALCGQTPFHEIEALGSLILAICGEQPPPIQRLAPWVPPQVATILHKALAQKPGDRFQSAYEMYRAIKAVLSPSSTVIEKSMIVPLTMEEKAFVAPLMTSTEPVLSTSAPGDDNRVVVRSIIPPPASITGDDLSEVESTLRAEVKSVTKDGAPHIVGEISVDGTLRSSGARTRTTSGSGQERARTTGGVTSEPGASAAKRPVVPIAIGAVALVGVAVFVGARFGGSSPATGALAAQQATQASAVVTASPAPEKAASPATATAKAPPVVAPAETATASAAASASAPSVPTVTRPLGKLPPPPVTKATAAPAATVGGRIIRTDLP
jgi:serine/threonine-protein kinase